MKFVIGYLDADWIFNKKSRLLEPLTNGHQERRCPNSNTRSYRNPLIKAVYNNRGDILDRFLEKIASFKIPVSVF